MTSLNLLDRIFDYKQLVCTSQFPPEWWTYVLKPLGPVCAGSVEAEIPFLLLFPFLLLRHRGSYHTRWETCLPACIGKARLFRHFHRHMLLHQTVISLHAKKTVIIPSQFRGSLPYTIAHLISADLQVLESMIWIFNSVACLGCLLCEILETY